MLIVFLIRQICIAMLSAEHILLQNPRSAPSHEFLWHQQRLPWELHLELIIISMLQFTLFQCTIIVPAEIIDAVNFYDQQCLLWELHLELIIMGNVQFTLFNVGAVLITVRIIFMIKTVCSRTCIFLDWLLWRRGIDITLATYTRKVRNDALA